MNCYPMAELGLGELLKRTVKLHYLSLRYSVFCILLITITKFLGTSLPIFLKNTYLGWGMYIISGLIISFFYFSALLATHRAFTDAPKTIQDAMKTIWDDKKRIYAVFLAYVGSIVALDYLMIGIIYLEDRLFPSVAVHGITMLLLTAILLSFVAMFFFAHSIAVIEKKSFREIVRSSLILGEKNKFGIFVLFAMLFIVVLLLAPNTMHEYYLSAYHLNPLYDFIVLSVLLPIYLNFTLLIINDSRQQMTVEEG